MTKLTQVNKEELEPIITSRSKAVEAAQIAEKALKDARLAELEFKVQIQQLYLNNNLDANCRVDISTGEVAWPEEAPATTSDTEEVVEEAVEPTKKKRVKKTKTETE